MNSKNKAVAENLYLATWWKYKKAGNAHYFNSDIFTWNNPNIKEEVMANIIAGQHNPKIFQKQLDGYKEAIPKDQLRLWRAEAKPINYSDELIEQNDIIFNSLVENSVNKSPNKVLELHPSIDQCKKVKSGSLKGLLILLNNSIIVAGLPSGNLPNARLGSISSITKQTINPNKSPIKNGIVFKKPLK